ncbi:MAG: DnaA/Hda family protein [Planctomycetota bacterium]
MSGLADRQEADRAGRAGRPAPGRTEGARGDAAGEAAAGETGGRLVGGSAVADRVAARVGAARFQRLFAGGSGIEHRGNALRVRVRDRFTADLIDRSCRAALDAAASDVGAGDGVRFEIDAGAVDGQPRGAACPIDAVPRTAPAPVRRGETPALFGPARPVSEQLARFVVGQSNRLAHAASCAMAAGERAPSLIFLHGGPGMGKTHLLAGIAQGVGARVGTHRVCAVSADAFIGAYVAALRNGRIDSFQGRYRKAALLCIDDVHLVAGKKGSQDELLRTLDALLESGAMIALASDAPPGGIESLQQALVSRFNGGVVARLDAPERELRAKLVGGFASRLGLVLSRGAVELLCDRTESPRSSVRDIEGILKQIAAVRGLLNKDARGEVSAVEAAHALDLRNSGSTRPAQRRESPPTLAEIRLACAEAMGVGDSEIMGKGRTKRVVLARELTVLLTRRLTGLSFPEIATGMGRTNHSTPITQLAKAHRQAASGEPLAAGSPSDGRSFDEVARLIERSLGLAPPRVRLGREGEAGGAGRRGR